MTETLKIDLVLFNSEAREFTWPYGSVWKIDYSTKAFQDWAEQDFEKSNAEAILFWDMKLGEPNLPLVEKLYLEKKDLFHAGLLLGMNGKPRFVDFAVPLWMLNCDPASDKEATSWRLSLRACLVRSKVLQKMGSIAPGFINLDAATLEMGHRYIESGVMMRYRPDLLKENNIQVTVKIPIEDELRFMRYRYGKLWSYWALMRCKWLGDISWAEVSRLWNQKMVLPSNTFAKEAYHVLDEVKSRMPESPKVSVVIPTVNRYAYLKRLVMQMDEQTVEPTEMIIVDQTPQEKKDHDWIKNTTHLPIRWIHLDHMGQCTARNEALKVVKGQYVLFLDDDSQIAPDMIESHLYSLEHFDCDASSGGVQEAGVLSLDKRFSRIRISDVFPTHNTLIRKEILKDSGLFDLAYDRRERADGDLGMRVYLSGRLMMFNPNILIKHDHAETGGLREHGARKITYAASRQSLFIRHLPSVSEIYLGLRYFKSNQVREFLWIKAFGTLSVRGNIIKKGIKFLVGIILLPDTLFRIRHRQSLARQMLREFPKIPKFENQVVSS